jgi:hypothetical protein
MLRCASSLTNPFQIHQHTSLLICTQMYPLLLVWLPTFQMCHSQ